MDTLTRAYDAKLDVSDGERSVVAAINTASLDRFKTVIEPAGIDLAKFRHNPVVLWEHGRGHDGKPIGRNAWIKYDKGSRSIVAKTMFHDDEYSDGIFKLYQSGGLRAFSVNILPGESSCSPPTAAEVRARPELAECRVVYRKSELAEYSAVSVPGNAEALALAVSRGLWVPEAIRAVLGAKGANGIDSSRGGRPAADVPRTPEVVVALPPLSGARTFGRAVADGLRSRREDHARRVARAVRDALDLAAGKV